MHWSRRCSVRGFHKVSPDIVLLHQLVSAVLCRGEVILHDAVNLIVGNATTAIRNPAETKSHNNLLLT